MTQGLITIPDSVRSSARDSIGVFFQEISRGDPDKIAMDHLEPSKSLERAAVLQRYTSLSGKKLLEIGSGYGTNLAVWIKQFGVDGYGVEPSGPGFGASLASSRELFAANGIDPSRLIEGIGESLPFSDASFEVVYSANVLEHCKDPERVLLEAVRVLRPGGMLHFELPNYLSYFEGHYMVIQPPIVFRRQLPFWVRLLGRNPGYAKTLDTRINPIWCRKTVSGLSATYPVKLLSLGEEIFLDRLSKPFVFQMGAVSSRLEGAIKLIQTLNVSNWAGRLIVFVKGYYPLYLTLVRTG